MPLVQASPGGSAGPGGLEAGCQPVCGVRHLGTWTQSLQELDQMQMIFALVSALN